MSCKKCFKCGLTKPLDLFYKHKTMLDGYLNKCKYCTKTDVSAHREKNIEKIREYDRRRGSRQSASYLSEYRKKYPNKYRAHCLVNNNIRKGNILKECCEICGNEKSVAHHDDYLKPLKVRWLCQAHHKQWHALNGEGKNPA